MSTAIKKSGCLGKTLPESETTDPIIKEESGAVKTINDDRSNVVLENPKQSQKPNTKVQLSKDNITIGTQDKINEMPRSNTGTSDSTMFPLVSQISSSGKDEKFIHNSKLKEDEAEIDDNNNSTEEKAKSSFYFGEENDEVITSDNTIFPQQGESEIKPVKRLSKLRQISVTAFGRLFESHHRRRLLEKCGESNVEYTKIQKRFVHFILDIFTTVIEIKWRYVFLIFFASFSVTWTVFAFVYWGIAAHHKDDVVFLSNSSTTERTPCVEGVTDFVTAFLFSLETMHTIGYGTRSMTDECPIAIFVLILQACFGVFMQSIVTAIVLAKIARPKWRGNTIMFSRYAVVNNLINNTPCLQFRVGDMRNRSHLVSTTIKAIWVETQYNSNDEVMPLNQHNFPVVAETGSNILLMTWPVTILHNIDENSPLYGLGQNDITDGKFEIIVILEGTIVTTGMSIQARTSYLPTEIFWNQKLGPLLSYKNKAGKYMVDHTKFHSTEDIHVVEKASLKKST